MSAFDAKLSVMAASLGSTTEEAVNRGEEPSVEMAITAGIVTPFGNPATGEPVVLPLGVYRFSFPKANAIELFEAALEAAKKLPDPMPDATGKILTASNMAQVEEAARRIEQAKRGV